MRTALKCLTTVAILLLPAAAFAQASLTGTVRDPSGALLPGVTVDAASPVLIEKVRTAVTDDSGEYRIIDLRPGTYTLTFTLSGFNVVRREAIELTGTQTLTIPIEMRVGGVTETITVTGDSPVVDVQNARREIVMQDEIIQALPAARAAGALLNATPGLTVDGNGVALSPTMTFFSARGGPAGEGRMAVGGMTVAAARSGGVSSYVYDTPNADEVAITVGGGLGESDIGGPVMNLVPRSGGNTFAGSAFLNLAGDWSRGSNLNDELRAVGLTQTPGIVHAHDTSASFGGPILKNRLWFYGSYRTLSTQTAVEGVTANANAGDPTRWDWRGSEIDSRLVQDRQMIIGRFTGQLGKSRVQFNSEYQHRCEGTPLNVGTDGCHKRGEDWVGLGSNNPAQSPEATGSAARGYFDWPFYLNQATWTMPATSRLLFDGGFTLFRYNPAFGYPPPDGLTGLIAVTEQSAAINPSTGLPYAPTANYTYRGLEQWGYAEGATNGWRGSMSYVTGAHNMKVGATGDWLNQLDQTLTSESQLAYRFNQGVPNAVTYRLPDYSRRTITNLHGLFVQDSYTRGRLTLQGALRYDRATSYAPVEGNGTTRTSWANAQPISIEETKGVNAFNDITPRLGVAYDVFGNGRTAVKFNGGRYLAFAANDAPYTSNNPAATVVFTVANRGWTDSNNNRVVDCDLTSAAAQNTTAAGGDICAAAINNTANFGNIGAATRVNPEVLRGWGRRPHDWQWTGTVQQELIPRVSAEFSYTYRTVPQLLRHRRSEPEREHGVRHLHADGPDRRAAPEWRWISHHRVCADGRGCQCRGAELSNAGERFRTGARQFLARIRPHPERAAAQRTDGVDRRQYRTGDHRRVRDGDEVRHAGSAGVPECRALPDDDSRSGELHRAEGRRPDQRHGSIPAACPAHRRLAGAEYSDYVGARPSSTGRGGQRQHHHRTHGRSQPSLRRQSADAGGHALRQDSALRPHPNRHRCGSEQPAQHQLRDHLFDDVFVHAARRWHVGQPHGDLRATLRAPQPHVRFLTQHPYGSRAWRTHQARLPLPRPCCSHHDQGTRNVPSPHPVLSSVSVRAHLAQVVERHSGERVAERAARTFRHGHVVGNHQHLTPGRLRRRHAGGRVLDRDAVGRHARPARRRRPDTARDAACRSRWCRR